MKEDTAQDLIRTRDGTATFHGRTYLLVDAFAIRGEDGTRMINAVDREARQTSPGYLPMTLLSLPPKWKKGGEVTMAVPNGEYDWIMCEQKGFLTSPRGYRGRRCHDC